MIKLYFGKSGAGKDTIVKEVLQKNRDIQPIVSYTTRPKRPNEVDGVDYHFVDESIFKGLIEHNKLTEYRVYDALEDDVPVKWYYGTPLLNPDENYAGVVDLKGVYAFLEKYGLEDVELIYVVVDDDNVRHERAEQRGGFKESEWQRRFLDDEIVFSNENLNKLCKLYGKPISCMHNNERLTFSKLEYKEV